MKSILETKTRRMPPERAALDWLAVVVGRQGGKIVHQLAVHLERLDDVPLVVEQCLAGRKMEAKVRIRISRNFNF